MNELDKLKYDPFTKHKKNLDEFKENALTYVMFNFLRDCESGKFDETIKEMVSDFLTLTKKTVSLINHYIQFEEFEKCQELYDYTHFMFEFMMKVEILRDKDSIDEEDLNSIEIKFKEIFNDIYQKFSN